MIILRDVNTYERNHIRAIEYYLQKLTIYYSRRQEIFLANDRFKTCILDASARNREMTIAAYWSVKAKAKRAYLSHHKVSTNQGLPVICCRDVICLPNYTFLLSAYFHVIYHVHNRNGGI